MSGSTVDGVSSSYVERSMSLSATSAGIALLVLSPATDGEEVRVACPGELFRLPSTFSALSIEYSRALESIDVLSAEDTVGCLPERCRGSSVRMASMLAADLYDVSRLAAC